MAEPPSKRARTTPSKPGDNDVPANEAASTNATPIADPRALAHALDQPQTRTPLRAASAGPSRTPASQQTRTPGGANNNARPFPVARRLVGPPTTPHAIRALQARRDAALAASGGRRNRRRSGVQERESPRDILRALSRRLAPFSQRLIPSPDVQQSTARPKTGNDDDDDGPDPPRPRLSMPLNEYEDDSFHEAPPRLSMALEDVDTTTHSVEGGRRAVSEDLRPRLSMARLRLSERFGDDMDVLSEDEAAEVYDATVGPLVFDGDAEDVLNEEMTNRFGDDDTTQELRAMLASRRRSRVSDINQPEGADLDEEPTFHFRMPGSRDPSLLLPQPEEEEEGDTEDAEGEDDDQDALHAQGIAYDQGVNEQEALDDVEPADALPGIDEEGDYETEPDADQDMEIDEVEQASEPELRRSSIARSVSPSKLKKQAAARRKSLKVSRYGTPYPSLPSSVMKRLATSFARSHAGPTTKLSKDTLDAISQASDWFFEQVGEDLASYAEHAGRKTIEEADVVALMSRQRQTNASTTPFSLAQKYLPRELLQEIRMPRIAPKSKRPTARKRSRMEMETIEEEAEE
ncbi:histone-fold domain containing protein [Diplodia corticola]|uniref:Histone-fold domain containing protein n=1 Tax=Diplodia corticola TaxID=236234 RepID=A0A1J9SAD2_9PEZI|nr:histone-fold domain containing protein [Diplodia corticola]OJD37439.1 histone-fold domain containing protein [Diplodia corticola]